MASPAPEAVPQAVPQADPKPLEEAPSNGPESGLNGHVAPNEPVSEPKVDSDKPVTNGISNGVDEAPTNGLSKPPTPPESGGPDQSAANVATKPEEPVAATSTAPEPAKETPEVAQPAEPAKPAEPAESVEPVEPVKPAEPAETPKVEKDESREDVEMKDASPAPPKPDESQPSDPTPASAVDQSETAQANAKEERGAPTAPAEEPPKYVEEPAKAEEPGPPTSDAALPTSEEPASLSQLAIETTEKDDASPVEASVDVSMADAPGLKVAREREDDASEGPAPKRARTEPKEDEPSADAAPAPTPTSAAPPTEQPQTPTPAADTNIEDLPKWNDVDFAAKPIQPFQLRDLRKSMARVKKTKNGAHFRDSVQRLWPALWDKYSTTIEKPMDLSEIDRNLRDGVYKTFGDVQGDLKLISQNCLTFNGPDHTLTAAAKSAVKSAWDDILAIPEEEPVKQKPPPKQNRFREPRNVTVKPEGTAAADSAQAGAAGEAAAAKPAPAPTAARRTPSTAEGDRPKRTVRAPKPKDIDYTTKPSRKKLKPELQFCDEVLSELMSNKYYQLNRWFNDPVDAEGLGIPHYYSIITNPMDFGKIQRMLHEGGIGSLKEFDKNVQLVFTNCYKFNGDPDPTNVSGFAKQLEDIYTAQMKGKDSWLAKHAKANPPPSASVGSDDEEEDDDGADDESAGPDPSREVKDLEVRLREEMDKQANLFAAEQPNQSMIQIQQGIVNMVQQALLQAKQKLNEYKQKNGGAGPKPKKAKAPKTKAAGGGGGRKSGGAAGQPKKASGGGGGQKKKKNLTASDKDNIANAINDLEYPHLDKAIDIIKRDTGQMESEDGELELDIDQLSHEALLKLWELCKKVLPGFGKDASAAANSSPEVSRGGASKQPKTAAKPKKNKPMSAQEQEARIAQLREIRDLYKPGQEPAGMVQAAQEAAEMDDSSDDSSEEE